MKRLLATFGLLLITLPGWSQSTNISGVFQNNFKKAERMYLQQGYRHAINLYRIVLDREPSNRLAKARVADCYYRMGQFEESARWYRELVGEGKPTAGEYYHLGMSLCALEKYDSAYAVFKESYARDSTDSRTKRKMEFIHDIHQHRRDPATYAMSREWYNSPYSDFSPRHFGDGIVFVSSRDRESFIKRTPWDGMSEQEGLLNAFYVEDYDSTRFPEDQVSLFYSRSLNSPYHDGPVTFFLNGTRIAYTRNLVENGKPGKDESGRVNLELYFATLGENRTLRNLEAFPYNGRSYSIAHPWISEDGKVLYFSSNMPGGKGGADLYVSYFDGKTWSAPQNLGDQVNTASDEFAPYLWGGQLFFSSDGFGGFGGLDNYVSVRQNNGFSAPENLGYPLNSSHDDFGLIIDGEGREGYFASNRIDRNDDIYRFRLSKVIVFGHVREMKTGEPVPLTSVEFMGELGTDTIRLKTDLRGNFKVELEIDHKYLVRPAKEGYTALSDQVITPIKPRVISDTLDLTLWKHNLYAMGVVYSNELQESLPGAMVYLQNLTKGSVDSVSTSDKATYQFLVLPNSTYRISARRPGYIENGFNLNTKGLLEGNLLNDILLEEEYLEKMTVFFGYDKWELRPEFEKDLRRIIRSLNRNKGSTVYVGAHADAQGTREYNKALSGKRAAAIVGYLTSRGISADRIQAFGFGEELILNTCSDGVDCSDEEHSKNRRGEIKVQLTNTRY